MTETAVKERNDRKTLSGWVISDKMDKTRAVRLVRRLAHPQYGKVITRHSKVYAHDEENASRQGDRVALMETRPLSRLKRFRVIKVLEKAKLAQAAEEVKAQMRARGDKKEPAGKPKAK
jgi:small subunit ribosomal protein S17